MAKIGKIQEVAIADLRPYERNAKLHSEDQVDKIAASIEEFGFLNPVLIDKDKNVIAGHGRIMAAQKLGRDKVPCLPIEGLTEAQRRAYILADNKLTEMGEWNVSMVQDELKWLDDIDFNISLTGFELNDFAEDAVEIIEDNFDESVLPAVPKAQLGGIYQLGRHRLMCGDSTDAFNVKLLMNGLKADMVFTDPPYGLSYSGGRTGGNNKPAHGQIINDDLSGVQLGELICNVFEFNKSEADVYICVSPIIQKPFLDWLDSKQKKLDAVIVWDKKNAGLGYMAYRRQCEFIYFIKGKPFHKGDASDFDLWSISKDNTANYIHGTQKPVEVPARAIKNSSKKDDNVLDLFGGSGSTLMACEQLERNCFMMELDPKYVDAIISRWECYTGEKAVILNG